MFCVCLFFNLISSYLISCVAGSFLILLVAFFGLIVLNMEILSLFTSINSTNILICSILNFIISFCIFKKAKSDFLKPDIDIKRIINSVKLDKILLFLSIAFVIFLILTFFLSFLTTTVEPDSQTYHFIRAYNFFKFHSLNHFETNDVRALIMPINSEIIYAWIYTLTQKLYGYALLSYISLLFAIGAIWAIFSKFKFAYRKRLYAIFLFCSFPALIVQLTSLQTDVIVGTFVLISFYLLIKNDLKINIYFSSLALALAFGIKSTGVICSFGFFIGILLYQKFIDGKINYKKNIIFFLFLVCNFIIFSSYNYILNFIQFHNFLSNAPALTGHAFWGGFKGYISNIINFIFQSFDTTGFKWGFYLNEKAFLVKNLVLKILNIPNGIGTNVEQVNVNIFTDEHCVGFGVLGFLVFLPLLIKSMFSPIFSKNKRVILTAIFALIFILNILILSCSVAYMVYSIRFIVAFFVVSSLILINAYKKTGIMRLIVLFFAMYYLILIPTSIRRVPFYRIIFELSEVKFNMEKYVEDYFRGKIVEVCPSLNIIYDDLTNKFKNEKNIAVFKLNQTSMLYLTTLEKEGRRIDFKNPASMNNDELKKYDLVVLETDIQNDNTFNLEDIQINYKLKNGKVIFNLNDKLNCYYEAVKHTKNDEPKITNRTCFTYQYMDKNKDFKLELIKDVQLEEIINSKIYYFKNIKH